MFRLLFLCALLFQTQAFAAGVSFYTAPDSAIAGSTRLPTCDSAGCTPHSNDFDDISTYIQSVIGSDRRVIFNSNGTLTGISSFVFTSAGNLSLTGNITANTFIGALTGNASTATALAANPVNCSAGSYPLGIAANGDVETCTAVTSYTDELAQDAVGGMVNTSLTYVDGTPSLAVTSRTIGGVAFDATANIVPQTIQIIDAASDTTTFPMLATAATGSLQPTTDAGLAYNASTNALTATTFTGALSGNSTTATALQNARTIGNVSFDGTANIVPETSAIIDSSDATSFLLMVDSVTGNLQHKTDPTITANPTTGAIAATTFSGALSGNATTSTALATNGTNCTAGQFPLGVAANGDAETCTALPTTITGTANEITASASTGAITLSLPTGINATKIADGSVTSTEFQYLNSVTSDIQTQFTNKQGLDTELTALASTTSAADVVPYFTGSGTATTTAFSSSGRALVGVSGTTDRLPYIASGGTAATTYFASAGRSLVGLTGTTDTMPYFSAGGTAALTTLTSFTRTILDDTTQGGVQSTLGLVPGTNVQAFDATLSAFAAYNTNGILTQTAADTFTGRTLTGTANAIDITNGNGVSGNPTFNLSSIVDLTSNTLRLPNSNTLPGTCTTGDFYMDTDATTGQRLYACESANTWVLQGDGGSGGGLTASDIDTSAKLAAILTDETGTGSVVFSSAPAFTGQVTFASGSDWGSTIRPTVSNGAALGSTSFMWADLFCASGCVLNFNAGDVTITHASNQLSFAGATTNGYRFANGPIAPSTNDGIALGTTALQFSDIFLASGAVQNWANGNATLTHSTGALEFTSADIYINDSTSGPGSIRLREDADNGTNYVGWQAPSSQASDVLISMPPTFGSAGQVLTADGSGGTSFSSAGLITNGSVTASTSGTSVSYTGLSSTCTKNIRVFFNDVSLSGSDTMLVQFGSSGGYVTSGYSSIGSNQSGSATTSTTGYQLQFDGNSARLYTGNLDYSISNTSNNTWIGGGDLASVATTGRDYSQGKSPSLGGAFDRFRIIASGANTFDSGEISYQCQ